MIVFKVPATGLKLAPHQKSGGDLPDSGHQAEWREGDAAPDPEEDGA